VTAASPARPAGAARPGRRRGRARLGALVVLLAVLVAAAVLAAGSGSIAPPATGAARLVPADALAYVNVSLDPRRDPVRRALRIPGAAGVRAAVEQRLGAIVGLSGDEFARAARPWLGDEAALALLAHGGRADSLIVLRVRDRRAAARFVGQGAQPAGSIGAAAVSRYPGGAEVALPGEYLVLGQPASVDDALRTWRRAVPALAAAPAFRRASAGEPDDRMIDAYGSGTGIAELLGGRRGLAGSVGLLLGRPGLIAVAASVSPAAGQIRMRIHSVMRSAPTHPAQPSGSFIPRLPDVLPAGASLLVDTSDLPAAAPRLLAAAAALGIGGQIAPLLARLGAALRAEGADVRGALALFGGETAVALSSAATRPGLLVVARTRHPDTARVQLAALEPALESLFQPTATSAGQAPLFTSRTIAGVTVHALQLAPGLQVDYAVFDGLVAISTGSGPMAALVRRGDVLADAPAYRAVLGNSGGRVSSLVFTDLRQLVRLAEQTGLLRSAALGVLRPAVSRARALGLRSSDGRNETTSEFYLSIQ
jgi:hypothetical protein